MAGGKINRASSASVLSGREPGMTNAVPPPGEENAAATDGDLIVRFRSGDARALDELLLRYETALFQFLIGILRDHHQAEDALQETWCRALERLDGVDPDHFRGWLFTVAYHQAMLCKRRQKSKTAAKTPLAAGQNDRLADSAPGPVSLVGQREEAQRLRDLLDRLPPGQREVIRQRVYEGKKFREIAASMDCPLNTALARMHEGLKRLRLLWESNHA
jgi:RNA polymerase sigma-70 factor (ECF subfamily)